MGLHDIFVKVRTAVTNEHFDERNDLTLTKPEFFNWVEEVFYELNVKVFPESKALLWRYNQKEKSNTFLEIYSEANRFLNFLRRHGV